MRTAYLDCFAGISGDMFLGALVDAGLDFDNFTLQLQQLPVKGLQIDKKKVKRGGLAGTKITIACLQEQPSRKLSDIQEIIKHSSFSPWVKDKALAVFLALAEAEAEVHGSDLDSVHFHELGAWDTIADVVGSVLGVEMLQLGELFCSKVHCGMGLIETSHGLLPVPAPATAQLLRGIPVYSRGVEAELVTPTGAALLVSLVKNFGSMPKMTVEQIGYGAGSHDLQLPNLLRLQIGRADSEFSPEWNQEEAIVLEASIDDMQPEFYGYVAGLLFEQGARDVFLTPIYMKKQRPAVTLSVVAPQDKVEVLANCIFEETTTLGLRTFRVNRLMLARETASIETSLGEVRVKIGLKGGKVINVAPEYEDCARLAREQGLPLKETYQEIMFQAREKLLPVAGSSHKKVSGPDRL